MHCAGFIDRNFEEIAKAAESISKENILIPISEKTLANVAFDLCDTTRRIIAVGESAAMFTGRWTEYPVQKQSVIVKNNTRERVKRELEAESLNLADEMKCFVDDVAVSGMTLRAARQSAGYNEQDVAVVGMAWDSRRLRKTVDMPLGAVVKYRQSGGGMPAVNSLSTFARDEVIAREYSLRRFDDKCALDSVLEIYKESQEEE